MIGHYNLKNKRHSLHRQGFALLYAIVMISVISAIAFGLATISIKQKILSSLAVDSQTAFYAADAGMECALFYKNNIFGASPNIPCFDIDPSKFGQIVTLTKVTGATPPTWEMPSPRSELCFSIQFGLPSGGVKQSFISTGNNTCIPNPNKYVERVLRAFF